MDKSWMCQPRSSGSGTIRARGKVSWAASSMEDTLNDQEVQTYTKKRKASWPSGSMTEILNELEETASSPCLTPLAPYLINDDSLVIKKKRGSTKCLKTHGLSHEDRIQVRLNILGQPIGQYRAALSSYLGTLARNAHIAPLTYTTWRELKDNWEDMWQTVKSKFDIEERGKKWVLQSIGSSWRTHKCRLKKKFFKPNMKEEYNLKNRPSIIPLEQWKILLKFWKSNMAKERSEKNKISRAQYTFVHTTGSKTFAEIREEERMKNVDAKEPSRVEMFLLTHKPKDGNKTKDGTSRIVSELEEAITLHPEAEESTTQDDLFSQVLGKERPGSVRTYGKGVAPTDLWGTKSTIEIQKIIDEVKRNARVEMQEEMQVKLQEQVEAIKTEMFTGFKTFLAQLQTCFPTVAIPEFSSMWNPNINERDMKDKINSHRKKKRKEEKAQKKLVERGIYGC
ncbi:uncharacterized protein LOC114181824 isoform X3 [Vigna unguiculata]|uniref:uncharacterized protein LOC114181824 isoform X3 n=1 Tax=Vigna unguiculata TaxID=3917 RepID=UPI001016FE6A|nr:uncharacterized protein LOC114181824 isoform X3 [Vigna unguiculata]